jgi:hypothetical protein
MRKLVLALASAAALSFGSAAQAAHDLPPGDFGSPLSETPLVLGSLLADTGIQNTSNSGAGINLNTQMRAAVYSGAGYLDFVYQITNLQSSNTSVTGLSFANFAGFDVEAYQFLGGIGVFGPGQEEADSARRNFDGVVLGVNFDTNLFPGNDTDAGANMLLNPGETSATFLFRVFNANAFRPGTFTAQDGVVVQGVGFSPAAVPEPGTWAMMLLGFGAVGFAMRRRRPALLTQVA